MGLNLLNAEQILAAQLPFTDVPVPEWGGSVRVRSMSGADREAFYQALPKSVDGTTPIGTFQATLVAFTAVDADGNLLFTAEQVELLRQRQASALERVAMVVMQMNGLGGAAVEDEVKNSNAGQSSASGTGSPPSSE
ncbi:hypothetical protein ABIC71_000913 [Herbaspirillum seropedicae]|uniref:hypothetical protein n=1 Tax=Herbaspirillum seropedicae TaxID=964 RepID=UPI0033991A77